MCSIQYSAVATWAPANSPVTFEISLISGRRNSMRARVRRNSTAGCTPRAATSFKPSSKPNTPATHAATYSPTLCPSNADGRIPQLSHSFANAYSTANSAGCVYAVSRSSPSLSEPYRTSNNGFSSRGARMLAHCSKTPRNTGCVS